jgi:signal transduction histidine kinase
MRYWPRGKWGGLLGFLVIAALVAGGLGWATAAVLRLENEQRTARAEAEQLGQLRLALWQLDSFILPDLSREDSRPYYHYTSRTPGLPARSAGIPLEQQPLPEWIVMHVEGSEHGWQSPQMATSPLPSPGQQKLPGADPDMARRRLRVLSEIKKRWQPENLLVLVKERSPDLLVANTPQVNTNPNQTNLNFNQVNNNTPNQNPQQLAQGDFNKRWALKSRFNNEGARQRAAPERLTVRLSRQMVPLWLSVKGQPDRLVLARRLQIGARQLCQAVVVDWQRLQKVLGEQIRDLFPHVHFVPVKDRVPPHPERTMTALPIEVVPAPVAAALPAPGWTPLRLGLVVVWAAVAVALLSVGLGGWSLLNLSERRSRFVSAVTHELRTPLTTLRLYLDMLTSGLVHEEKQKEEYLQTLHAEADRLNRLIGNVLDFSRLEKQRPRLEEMPVSLSHLLAQICSTWQARCQDAGKEFVIDKPASLDLTLITDQHLVQQVLGNLIDNACKYSRTTQDPRLWLRVRTENQQVVFEVEDRGPGIPNGERRSIFSPFRRGRQAEETAGGVGLGLALARRWAHLLGGRLTLQPAADARGACFRLTLPVS